jgi:hypothetical protein
MEYCPVVARGEVHVLVQHDLADDPHRRGVDDRVHAVVVHGLLKFALLEASRPDWNSVFV